MVAGQNQSSSAKNVQFTTPATYDFNFQQFLVKLTSVKPIMSQIGNTT